MTIRLVTDRDGLIESEHLAIGVVVDPAGEIVWSTGSREAEHPVFMRSAAKPFQAAGAVAAGVLDELGLTDRHLAVACASHNASPMHLGLVDEILAAAGLGHAALRCGSDGQGPVGEPGDFEHQCSGNHALGLAWCVVAGWPIDTYLDAAHPLQENYGRIMADVTGTAPETARDGCAMTAYRVPLRAYATAFLRLASDAASVDGMERAATAMRTYPEIVRWAGEVDCELMTATPAFVAKVGAEGSLGAGHAAGFGAAVKVLDGAVRGIGPAMIETLGQVPELADDLALVEPTIATPPILDGHGQTVGRVTVVR